MEPKVRREINQLWLVAQEFYNVAISKKNTLPVGLLAMTVREFSRKCQDRTYLNQNMGLLIACANLASSAIRLYSIDECQKCNSKRWSKYHGIFGHPDHEKAKRDILNNLDLIIHFLLRHTVAHSEDEWKDNKQYEKKKIGFESLEQVYLDLTYEKIFSSMTNLMRPLEVEIPKLLIVST